MGFARSCSSTAASSLDRIDEGIRQDAIKEILDQGARVKEWPKVDFFKEFP